MSHFFVPSFKNIVGNVFFSGDPVGDVESAKHAQRVSSGDPPVSSRPLQIQRQHKKQGGLKSIYRFSSIDTYSIKINDNENFPHCIDLFLAVKVELYEN